MVQPAYPKVYKEVRLDVDSDLPSAKITITLPGKGFLRSRGRQALVTHAEPPVRTSENPRVADKLSSAAGVFSHRCHRQPQRLLWRLDHGCRILTLSSIDVLKEGLGARATLSTISIAFPGTLQAESISFTENPDHAHFHVFLLSTEHEIYDIRVAPQYFQEPTTIPTETSEWCQVQTPGAFSFRYPHRLVACDYSNVLVSLHDGGILRLRRSSTDPATGWTESYFNEGGWTSSIRNFIPWQGNHVVRHGALQLEQGTAVSIALLPDQKHIIAITLDHSLKAWNASSGKISAMVDLLDRPGEAHHEMMWKIDPSQTHLLELLDEVNQSDKAFAGRRFRLVTFSPVAGGQFKFWRADSMSSGQVTFEDLFPNQTFEPLAPSAEAWSIRNFQIAPVERAGLFDLWVLWKSAHSYRVHRIQLDLNAPVLAWSQWKTVAEEAWRSETANHPGLDSPEDHSEPWIHYLSEPGRFGTQTLSEAAQLLNPAAAKRDNFCSRLDAVSSFKKSLPGKGRSQELDESGNGDPWPGVDEQWRKFLRVSTELERQRWEALALSVDWQTGTPVVVTTDGLALIRDSSEHEILTDNPFVAAHSTQGSDLARFISLVFQWAKFWESFAGEFLSKKDDLATVYLDSPDSLAPDKQLTELNNQITDAISDQEYRQLISALHSTYQLGVLTRANSEAALLALDANVEAVAHRQLTFFGEFALSQVIKEQLSVKHSFLESMLLLVVLMDQGDAIADIHFDIDRELLFTDLVSLLRQNATTRLLASSYVEEAGGAPLKSSAQNHAILNPRRSQLQELALSHRKFALPDGRPSRPGSSYSAMGRVHAVITGASLLTSFAAQTIFNLDEPSEPGLACSTIASLLQRDQLKLAQLFEPLLPRTPWSDYLRARISIANAQYKAALRLLRRAATGLASMSASEWRDTSQGLCRLPGSDGEAIGLGSYYAHIADLFHGVEAWDSCAECLELALRTNRDQTLTEVPSAETLNNLFTAYLRAQKWDAAYSVLARWRGPDRSALRESVAQLTRSMYRADETERLLSYPFVGLVGLLDEVISDQAREDTTTSGWALVLYSWRLRRKDIRGAAESLWDHIVHVRSHSHNSTSIIRPLLLLINVLSMSGVRQGWILGNQPSEDGKIGKRKLMGVREIRKMYQEELDRLDEEDRGDFDFVEPMDSYGNGNGTMELDVLS